MVPAGAWATLLRDLSYAPGADTSFSWLVLAGWAGLGLGVAAVGHFRARSAALAPARTAGLATTQPA